MGKDLCFVRRMGKEERAPILVEFLTQYGAEEGLRRLRIRWGELNREVRRAVGNREGLGFSQFHSSEVKNRVIMLTGVGKTLKKAFGQREKGQEGVLSYEIIPARESPRLKLRMRVGGRSNVLHFFPVLSRNYRTLRDIEEDSLGEGREGIYGDFRRIGDQDLGLEVGEIKWIVDQIVRGAEQNVAVVRSCGIIPSVVDIVNRKGVGVRGGVEAEIGDGAVPSSGMGGQQLEQLLGAQPADGLLPLNRSRDHWEEEGENGLFPE